MKHVAKTAAVIALGATSAVAGGVERSTQSVAILFEQGRYAEMTFSYASPDVDGGVGPGAVVRSGDMAGNYFSYSLGYKQPLGDNIDIAFVLDQPIGADVDYPAAGAYPLRGSTAKLTSNAITGLLRYKFENGISIIGGLRAQSVKGKAQITAIPGYTLATDTDYRLGYVIGAAWERPDIQARVALTYNSAITHTLNSVETGPLAQSGSFDTEVPQSVNLEFQTGISRKYQLLLMGSIRWVDWSEFVIDPPGYPLPSPLVSYQSDRVTYNLGLGKRFNENWSGSIMFGYEPSNGDLTGNLGPTDGFKSVGIGVQYTDGNVEISGGVRYIELGNATTIPPVNGQFTDNNAIAAGIKIAYTF